MANMTPTEAAALANIKDPLLAAKTRLRLVEDRLAAQIDNWHAAGKYREEAAAMRLRGGVLQALGILDGAHGATMDDVCACFDDGAQVLGGGGGR